MAFGLLATETLYVNSSFVWVCATQRFHFPLGILAITLRLGLSKCVMRFKPFIFRRLLLFSIRKSAL